MSNPTRLNGLGQRASDAKGRAADEQPAAALEQHVRLYETILSNTPDLVYVFGLDHRFTYANAALLTMWGKTWDEAIGKNCLELGYPEWHAAMHDREIDEVIATKQPIRGEVPFDGTVGRRMYEYIFVPVIGATGEVEAVAGTTRDVTERRRAEDTLRESEQRLTDANRVKDEFLAILSHELRTPLNAVLGWAHMLRAGTIAPEVQRRALEALERNAKLQAQLVDDLLDVSRIMSGKLRIDNAAVDLAAVVADAVDAVRSAAAAKQLPIAVRVDSDAQVIVTGDEHRLAQIASNLLANAVKFTPAGGHIDVELRHDAASAEMIMRDTGEGIDPAFLPHVFDRFRQADSARSRKHGGLGLGLAIARHLAEAHGGTIEARSDGLGKGATFVVRLPGRIATRRAIENAAPAVERSSGRCLVGLRLVVVDDEPDARDVTKAILEYEGAEVVPAESAGEALHAISGKGFDALVADIGMPEQDGYWLIRAVRSLPPSDGGTIPAVALTAWTAPKDREEAIAAGYDRHLGKPVDPDALVATVSALVARTNT